VTARLVSEPHDADHVVFISRNDVVFRPRLAEKKFVVIKVDGEKFQGGKVVLLRLH